VSSVATSLSRRFYSRTAILIAFLFLELAFAWSFRALGWFETGGLIRWGACALLALAPLVVAAALLARRRFRFGMRTLLIAMSLLAIFMWASVLPLYEAIEARRGSQALLACRTRIKLASGYDEYFKRVGYDPRRTAPAYHPEPTLPAWLRPLAAETLQAPADNSICEVWFDNDAQVAAFAEHATGFTRLKCIGLSKGVGLHGKQILSSVISKLPNVDQLYLDGPIPEGWLRTGAFNRIRSLKIDGLPRSHYAISKQILAEVVELPDLRHLSLWWVEISDADLQEFAKSTTLRLIELRVSGATSPGFEQLGPAMPDCRIKGLIEPEQPVRAPRRSRLWRPQ